MDRMIFITGEGHSGSTLLDMLLSTGGRSLSLGEITTVARRTGDRIFAGRCSCGQLAADCDFWDPVLSRFGALGEEAPIAEKYHLVLEQVEKLYGPGMHVIDSSKKISSLKLIEKFADFEIIPIHLVKDVRSFSTSMIDKSIKKNGVYRVLEPELLFLNWYRHNRIIERHLEEREAYTAFRVVYEELVRSTDLTIDRINKHLGATYIDLDGRFNSHVISGNRMKNKIGKPRDIHYDFRWLSRTEWLRPYALMPFVRRYNQSIYSE